MTCTLYIVRHGQSHENVDFRKGPAGRGHDLTPLGIRQVSELRTHLKDKTIDAFFSSHLLRAAHSAAILAHERGLTVQPDERLAERRVEIDEASEQKVWHHPELLYGDPSVLSDDALWDWKPFPDMESQRESLNRFIRGLNDAAAAYQGKTVCIVTHGQVMRLFLIHLGYGSFKTFPLIRNGSIRNAGWARVQSGKDGFVLQESSGITVLPEK